MTNYLTEKWVTFEITTITEPSNMIFSEKCLFYLVGLNRK